MKKTQWLFAIFCLIIQIFISCGLKAQFSFIHITDIHVADGNPIGNIPEYDMNGVEFNCCIKAFRIMYPQPSLIVASGDISNVGGAPPDGMYTALTKHLFPHPYTFPFPGDYFIDFAQTIPIYFTPGNHEYYEVLVPPVIVTSPVYYVEYVSPDKDYSINKNNAVILMLRTGGDTPFWEGENPFNSHSTGLSDEQCSWLRETLKTAGDKRKIIVMHHPVRNSSGILYSDSARFPVPSSDGSFLNNRSTFLNICDSNLVDIVLIGHTHNNVVLNRGGYIVDENWKGGTRYVQTAAELNGNYRIITVNASFVNVSKPQQVDCSNPDPENNTDGSVAVYPNPVSSLASLELHTGEYIVDYQMRIFTVEGIEVKRIKNINATITNFERGNLLPGIYFYTVYNGQDMVKGSGKISITAQ